MLKGQGQKLAYLGINTEDLTPDNIVERITLSAPRSGYISKISVHDGMYVDPSTELMEIIDENHLHLELDVFERDIARLEKDQRFLTTFPPSATRNMPPRSTLSAKNSIPRIRLSGSTLT